MSKSEMNVQQLIQDKVTEFVSSLTQIMEQSAQDNIREKVASIFGEMPVAKKTINVSKRNYQRKPCPVDGCENLAAPRYHQVCVEHGRQFNAAGSDGERQRDLVLAKAKAPGGRWYQETKEKQQSKRGRKAVAA